nr:hypothetical protein [Tanacetum cinerariifolium]
QASVVDNSLSAELATYKEQVELYERRDKFELTEREQKIDEQLRIIITDRNIMEENLKKELHYVKMQLSSTINHNKSMVEEVTSLKNDFKQKENKYLEEFLDMKALKEKVQPALYNGHEIIKTNHIPAIVYNSEETLKIVEFTKKKINDKMKDPKCVKKKVKIASHDYSKEYYLATFTQQKQLNPEQIFWSKDLLKMKEEALKEQTIASRPIKALTMNNREVHLDYLKHLKESVATLREIVEEDKVEKPFDSSLAYACRYTNLSRIGVKGATAASESKPRRNTKKDRTLPAKHNMQKVEVHPRNNNSNVTPTPVLDKIIVLSSEIDIMEVMKILFEQHIPEEEAFTKYIHDKIADVKASLTRVRTVICEMESKSDKDAWKDAIDCFKETKDRLELKLSRLT